MTGPTDGERHGVRARWLDVPGTVVGTLTFGVGAADEPPYLAGITHLAEHLVFRSIGDVGARANGVTGPDTVTFFTTGTAREVADFLEAVAAAVREPRFSADDLVREPRFSADDLVRELHVIRAERPGGESPDLGLLTYRFGLTGPGLAGAGWPALPAITVEEVREWMAHWFVAANAVLTSSAPLPTDLDLRLPIGRSPQRSVPVPIVRAATLVEAPKHGVAASLLVPGEHADVLGACLERELFTELRTRRALVYTVAADTTPVGPDAVHLSLVLDPATVDVPATVELLVTTLRRIAVDGVRAEVLADAVAAVAAARGWWGAPIDELDGWAEATLAGRPAPREGADAVAHARTATSVGLSAALAAALPTLVVAHEEGPDLTARASALGLEVDEGLPWYPVPTGEVAPRAVRWHRARATGEAQGGRMGVDGAHLWGRHGDDTRWLPLADVVLVAQERSGAITLVDRRGRGRGIDPADWRKGDELVAAVLAGTRNAVVRDASWPDRGRSTFGQRAPAGRPAR